MNKVQTRLAGACAILLALVLTGVGYLVFAFPRVVNEWAESGRSLSTLEQAVVNLSNLCKSFGMLLIPLLVLGIVGCVIWALMSGARDT